MQLTLDRRTLLVAGAVIAMAVLAFAAGRSLGGSDEPSVPAAKLTPVKSAPAPSVRALGAAVASPSLRPAARRKRTASTATQTASQPAASSPTTASPSAEPQTPTAGSGSAPTSNSTPKPLPQQEEPVSSGGE